LVVLAVTALGAASAFAQKPMTLDQVEAVARSMQKAHEALGDYITVIHQRLRYDDELSPPVKLLFKFKKPFSVYLRWLDGGHQGREVIYVKGANDGKMWVHNGSFPDITLCLDPDTCQALSNSLHPVTEAGLGFIADVIARDVARAKSRPLDKVSCWDYGQQEVFGEPSRCLELVSPPRKDSGYYGHRAYVCQSRRTGLLNEITVWDFRNLIVEDYGFERTQADVGLQAKDFDHENPDYKF
jgi:hypothetical protein